MHALQAWLAEQYDIATPNITIASFEKTGRGIRLEKNLQQNDIAFCIPKRAFVCLDTIPDDIFKQSLNAVQCVCLYLTQEKRKQGKSHLQPFLQSIPDTFTNACNWQQDELNALFGEAKKLAEQQLTWLQSDYQVVQQFCTNMTLEEYKWVFSCYYTRCLFLNMTSVDDAQDMLAADKKDASFALVPLLDMMNHSYEPNCRVYFDTTMESFVVQLLHNVQAGEQLLFTYGPHDNTKLLIEYGFILPNNPHNHVPLDAVLKAWLQSHASKQVLKNLQLLKEKKLFGQYACMPEEGLSMRTLMAFRLLVLKHEEQALQKNIFAGLPISKDNEKEMQQLAKNLCRQYHDLLAQQLLKKQKNYIWNMLARVAAEQANILSTSGLV